MEIVRNIGAHKTEEGCNREGLVAVSNNLEVDTVLIVQVRKKRDRSVDRDHEKDSDYMSLLVGSKVMCGVHEDEKERDHNGDETEDGGQPESQSVKRVVMPDRNFSDRLVLKCSIALGPAHLGNLEGVSVESRGAHSRRSGGVFE